ncbi:conserved hypothetical protein [Burkholderia pseudomallei 305]|nr:conserved hypothetical protein [Burkholderia pseudomallei 305]
MPDGPRDRCRCRNAQAIRFGNRAPGASIHVAGASDRSNARVRRIAATALARAAAAICRTGAPPPREAPRHACAARANTPPCR